MQIHSVRRSTHKWSAWMLAIAVSGCVIPATCWAQSTSSPPPASEQSALTEGLLELAGEEGQSSAVPIPDRPNRIDTAKVAGQESSPLQSVVESMQTASGLLASGGRQQALLLQSEIVGQLDQLISELEKQQSSQSRSRSQQQIQQATNASSSATNTSSSGNRSPRAGDQAAERQSGTPSEQTSTPGNGSPGEGGPTGDTTVRTGQPTALQQSVWGHLPERVRSQMQSRMVEEFLPSYREKIEAYYRAMLSEGKRQ